MILLYRGKSFVSWRIKCATLSPYSHAAWLKTTASERMSLRENCHDKTIWPELNDSICDLGCIEAWHKGEGVRETDSLRDGHKPGTVIDIFDPIGMHEWKFDLMAEHLRGRVGDAYWFAGILWARTNRFNRHDAPDGKWFCSHLLEDAMRYLDCPTTDERIPAHGVWPGSFERSVLTNYLGSIKI